MRTMGVDIGTTTICAVVLDHETREVVESKTVSNGSFIDTGNEWERIQDASVIIPKALEVVDEMLGKYPEVKAIGLTCQMHGIVYLNEAGECISPLYTWQDTRGSLPVFDGASAAEWANKKYGMAVAPGYGLVTHLYHVKMNMVPAEAVSLCTIGDYLGMKLTGRTRPLTHSSNAASMGFYDAKNGGFFKDYVADAGMDVSMLPEVDEDIAVLGEHKGVPVTICLGDNQASFMGAVGLEPNSWLMNVGTSGQISVLSDVHFEGPCIEARPYVKGKYLLAGSTLCGGRAYAILEKFFRRFAQALGKGDEELYGVMADMISGMKAPADGMRIKTTFSGTRVDPKERGSIENLSEDNFTPENMIYGILQGISQELYSMYELIHEGTGIKVEHLSGSGNAVRRNVLLQNVIAEMFGAELVMSPYKEEAASGAAVSCTMANI